MHRRKFLLSSLSMGARAGARCAWVCVCGLCNRGLLMPFFGTSAAGLMAGAAAQQSRLDIPVNTWIRRTSPPYPLAPSGPNKHIKMTYNSLDRKVYLVGGDYNIADSANGASHEMVYRYDVATNTWENVLSYANSAVPGYPEGRCAPGWTYDSKRNVMWLGMGQNRQATPRPGLRRGGLWSFDPTAEQASGQVWKLEGPDVPNPYSPNSSTRLPANTGSEVWYMQYDPATDALYALYVRGLAKYDLREATIRDGVPEDRWSHIPLGSSDIFIGFPGMLSFAVDTKRANLVFYFPWPGLTEASAAVNRGETWEYSTIDGTWRKLSEAVLPARSTFGMVYDSANDKIVMFGGYDSHESGIANPLNDVWIFDRNPASPNYHRWVRLAVAGTPPTPRKGETIAYDAYNNVVVQFGGRGWDSQPDASDIYLLRLGSGTPDFESPPVPSNLRVR